MNRIEVVSIKEENDVSFSVKGILRYRLSVVVKLENKMTYKFTFEKNEKDKVIKLKDMYPQLWTKYPNIREMFIREAEQLSREYDLTDEKTKEIAVWILNHKRIRLRVLLLSENY